MEWRWERDNAMIVEINSPACSGVGGAGLRNPRNNKINILCFPLLAYNYSLTTNE